MDGQVVTEGSRSADRARVPRRRRTKVVLAVAAAVALGFGLVTVVGLPLPGRLGRPSARALTQLADHINDVCDAPFGEATVDWLGGRVDQPSGAPMDLTPDQVEMLGNGPKVGCLDTPVR